MDTDLSNHDSYFDKYMTAFHDERPQPYEVIPKTWDQEARHFLFGSFRSIKTYCHYHYISPRESDNGDLIVFVTNVPDATWLIDSLFSGYVPYLTSRKLQLHMLPGSEVLWDFPDHIFALIESQDSPWRRERLRFPWYSADQVRGAFVTYAAYSFLEAGHEVDLATGYPAILDPPPMPNLPLSSDPYLIDFTPSDALASAQSRRDHEHLSNLLLKYDKKASQQIIKGMLP